MLWLLILSVSIALGVSFCCSLLEACVLSLSTTDIAALSEKKPIAATIWRGMKENIQKPIAVILILNTLANTMGASVAGAQFNALFGPEWILVFSLVLSVVIILWTELLPKTLGVRYNRGLAQAVAVPLKFAVMLFSPVVKVIEWIHSPFQRRSGTKGKPDALNDINLLARFAAINNQITREQEVLVARSIKLSNALVKDIMVDRSEIKCLSTAMTMVDAIIEAHIHHHTRYVLVKDGNLDEVIGYVNVKDIVSALQMNPSNPTLTGIARPVIEVQALQKVTAILSRLTKGYQHMAIVKDEAGKTAGLITLEDVVETIVGDIEDEYDVVPNYAHKLSDMRYLVGGGIPLSKLRDVTGFSLPETDLQVHIWIDQQLAKAPTVETKIQFRDTLFVIRKVRRSRVHELIVEKRTTPTPKPEEPSPVI